MLCKKMIMMMSIASCVLYDSYMYFSCGCMQKINVKVFHASSFIAASSEHEDRRLYMLVLCIYYLVDAYTREN